MTQKRNIEIDLLKGIGIVLMVMGHANAPGKNFIYLFHMAIFFMASGYLYKETYTDSLKSVGKFLWKRVRSLYVPYVLADTMFNLLNNLFLRIHFYADSSIKETLPWGGMVMTFPARPLSIMDMWQRFLGALTFHGSAEMGMALWFLQTLFEVSVLYVVVDFCIKKVGKNGRAGEVLLGVIAVCFCCCLRGILDRWNCPPINMKIPCFLFWYRWQAGI